MKWECAFESGFNALHISSSSLMPAIYIHSIITQRFDCERKYWNIFVLSSHFIGYLFPLRRFRSTLNFLSEHGIAMRWIAEEGVGKESRCRLNIVMSVSHRRWHRTQSFCTHYRKASQTKKLNKMHCLHLDLGSVLHTSLTQLAGFDFAWSRIIWFFKAHSRLAVIATGP